MTDFRYIVTTEDEGMEVREIMRKHFDFSARLRNKIKREKLVFRNGLQAEGWHKASAGDEIVIKLPDEKSNFEPEPIPLSIVYEDDDMMIINKQPGLIVHPTKGYPSGTVANALTWYMREHGQSWKIRFVNRLDMDTSGLLVVAKNAYCQNDYTKQSKNDQVRKYYTAVVHGIIEEEQGTIDLPIGRPDPGDVRRGVMAGGAQSVTHYKVLERFESSDCSIIRLRLETGRTHQIRVHMSFIGHPVVADPLYADDFTNRQQSHEKLPITRQALHASRLEFIHPITKEPLKFEAPLPDDMKNLIKALK